MPLSIAYKNPVIGLLFCVFLGPIGLLYASFWAGFFMIFLGIVVIHAAFFFPILLFWIVCCIWGMGAIDQHNKKILKTYLSYHDATQATKNE